MSADKPTPPAPSAELVAVRALARLMDNAFVIPGTNFRFGLDAILDVIPIVGDVAGTVVSLGVVGVAARSGVPRVVLARMLLNLAADTAVGAVPVIGPLFDAAHKANVRNVRLLEQALTDPRSTRRAGVGWLVGLVVGGVVFAVAGLAVSVWLGLWLWHHIG